MILKYLSILSRLELDRHEGLNIISTINGLKHKNPQSPLSVQYIAHKTGSEPYVVKQILYSLLHYKELSATFVPKHIICKKPLSHSSRSVYEIYNAFYNENLKYCFSCFEEIESINDFFVEINFWNPDTIKDLSCYQSNSYE